MFDPSLRGALHLAIGVVLAALVLQTFLVLGWVVPVTVSGSSMAPALIGPHRMYRCADCRHEFAVGLDQLPRVGAAICPGCGQRTAAPGSDSDRPGERLSIDRTAFDWRGPRRWETVVFRRPEDAGRYGVKRVVGLPGETVALDDGDVVINGQFVSKSLAEQRTLRQEVFRDSDEREAMRFRIGEVTFQATRRWRPAVSGQLEYRHLGDGPILDDFSHNQGVTPPAHEVADTMLTFMARLSGEGQLALSAANKFAEFEVIADFEQRRVTLRIDKRIIAELPLPPTTVARDKFDEWTFSLFDRQVLVAIGDRAVLAAAWQRDTPRRAAPDPPFSIGVRGLRGEIRSLAVWRDAYYAMRHGDGRQRGAARGGTATWQLGPDEYFVLGDNAAISDDSRSWPIGPGLDAKLLIGRPLGAR